MSSFHVRDQSGQQFGPCSPGELRAWIAEGRVTADMVVQQVGTSGWYRVSSVPALSSAIAQRVATEQSRQPAKSAPPEDAEVKYFVVTGSGAVEGPLLLGAIAGAVASGRIPRDAQLCVQGHDEWFPIARVLGEVSCIPSQSQSAGTNVAHGVDGMTRYWVQGANSQAYGPYDLATIRTYLAEGRLPSDCQACVVGESHWRPISVVLERRTPPPSGESVAETETVPPWTPVSYVAPILVTIFCFPHFFGLISIFYVSRANSLGAIGDIEGAREAYDASENWMNAGIVIVVIAIVIGFLSTR